LSYSPLFTHIIYHKAGYLATSASLLA